MRKTAFLPCIPTRGVRVPSHPDWIHEVKHDGYRLIVQREGKRVRLWTRNGYDWSGRFPLITEAALRVKLDRFVVDGKRSCQASTAFPISPACTAASLTTRCSSMPLTYS
jgi:bifunctional non-homologous end joining protein LigD